MDRFTHLTLAVLFTSLMFVACEDPADENDTNANAQLYTEDINYAPQFLDLDAGTFATSDYDLSFQTGQMSYTVKLNSQAGVLASGTDTLDFETEELPAQGYLPDSNELVIGATWMDISSYNPVDHSIGSNDMVYFIRSSDYRWVKFRVLSGTTSAFGIEYAEYNDNTGYGATQSTTVPYSADAPGLFSFSQNSVVEATEWDLVVGTTPEYSPELQTNFYMPTILLSLGTRMAVIEDASFEAVTELPAGATWMEDSPSDHPLGNGGSHQVLVYHPEPPYNHKVIVEYPDRIYVIDTGSGTYKLQFDDYSSGIVVYRYETIQP